MPEIVVSLGENVVHKYFFEKDVLSIGRGRDNDIVIENLAVSRNHSRIKRQNGKYVLIDLNSANGTYVNGVKITKTELFNEDVISIGKHKLKFQNKVITDTQIVTEALGADRTVIVDRAPIGVIAITKGKQRNRNFTINTYETFIGRSSSNDIRLHDWFVSKRHAKIIRQGSAFFIKDLGSWRGILINGTFQKEAELKDGDVMVLGSTHLEFNLKSADDREVKKTALPKELASKLPEDEIGVENVASEREEEDDLAVAAGAESFTPEEPEIEELPEDDEIDAFLHDEEAALAEAEKGPSVTGNDLDSAIESALDPGESPFDAIEQEEEIEVIGIANSVEIFDQTPEVTAQDDIPAQEEITPVSEISPTEEKVEIDEEVEITTDSHVPNDSVEKEIALWEKTLENKSEVIRREALRRLKQLTGKDYST